MIKRVFFEDIATLALLYHYEATASSSRMLPKSIIQEYAKVIDANLDEMESTINMIYPLDYEKLIYKNTQDENGIWYCVLKYDIDVEEEKYNIQYNILNDLIEASQKPNALETLGIQLKEGKMVKIEQQTENKLDLEKIIERAILNSFEFYKKIASVLTPQEREFLKKQIEWKCCLNCTNPSCQVESFEKTNDSCCVAWENEELIGRQLILKNRNEG